MPTYVRIKLCKPWGANQAGDIVTIDEQAGELMVEGALGSRVDASGTVLEQAAPDIGQKVFIGIENCTAAEGSEEFNIWREGMSRAWGK